jgi:uncharacterized protein (TIRG00374 family)
MGSASGAVTEPGTNPSPPTARRALRRAWPVLRWVLGLGLAAGALLILYGKGGEERAIGSLLGHLHWWWIPAAVVFEAVSFVALAGLQYRLLRTAGVHPPAPALLGVTTASQAMANSLPGGPALAAVYSFRWYRRFGADDAGAGWALVGTWVGTALSLSLLAAAGLLVATSEGATLDLIPAVVGVLLFSIGLGLLFVYERPLAAVVRWSVRALRRVTGRPRGDLAATIDTMVARALRLRLGWSGIRSVVGWGLANWMGDCACFALSFLIVGVGIPWKSMLLAYGAGQLAANLPITPGGLGTVDGSIEVALTYFGGSQVAWLNVVFVYRLLSFWLVLVVGWLWCGRLAWTVHRGRWPRHLPPGREPVAGTPLLTGGT